MAGAIALVESMEATKCLPYMMKEMKALTDGHLFLADFPDIAVSDEESKKSLAKIIFL
jgi:hypothetical protein